MILLNTITENGFRYGDKYHALQYQLALTADNAPPVSFSAFLGTVRTVENQLTADIRALVPNLNIAAETRERAALFSLEVSHTFNNANNVDALTAMLTAIKNGDRAEAWYQLRYGLNSAADSNAARAHFDEAQMFGLFQSAAPGSSAHVADQEALLAFRMATLHANTIATYEIQYAAQIALSLTDMSAISLHTGTDFGAVTPINTALAPALTRLAFDYTDLAHLAPALNAELPADSALAHPAIAAVWVAPSVAGDQGAEHVVDRSAMPAANDLIFGSISATLSNINATDTLKGGAGDDFIIGSKSADVIDGGAGEDTVSFLFSSGGVTLDLSHGTGSLGDAKGDTYAGIENVLGTGAADKLTGDAADNILYGGNAADRLVGSDGSDVLIGGNGNDKLYGDGLKQTDGGTGGSHLSAVAQADITHGNTLVGGLGGTAGYGENFLSPNDDGSTGAIDITSVFGASGLNFFGTSYTQLFVNNNGNITFNGGLSAFTPGQITAGAGNPIIAAFWADVDTRGSGGVNDLVYYDLDAANGVFTATWDQVGFFSGHTSPYNSFQLELLNEGHGNFDIVLRYETIGWTTGDFSAGSPARAGYSAGNGHDYFELSQSGDDAALRNLPATTGNTGLEGVFVFHVLNGQVLGDANDTLDGGSGADLLTGGQGADLFIFHAGEANGDTVADFSDASGDMLKFVGYAPDATLTQIDATHWQIGSDVITFSNAPTITAEDYILG